MCLIEKLNCLYAAFLEFHNYNYGSYHKLFQKSHIVIYRITGIIHRRKVLRISFFAIVREKTFAIQAISYIKILVEIESAIKHLQILPDS